MTPIYSFLEEVNLALVLGAFFYLVIIFYCAVILLAVTPFGILWAVAGIVIHVVWVENCRI
jgi:hypothetical protein